MTAETSAPAITWETDDEVILVVTPSAGHLDAVVRLTLAATARFEGVTFLSANRPYRSLQQQLGKDAEKILFIDCITPLTGTSPPSSPNVIYVESPTLLEVLAMRGQQVLRRLQAPRFLLVDSLSTLALYNSQQSVHDLARHIGAQLQAAGDAGAFIVVEGQTSEADIDALARICDRVVRL